MGMSHLYVMQNHVGFVKIGRSVRVEARRRSLETTDECTVAIVAVVEDAGDYEETILLNLNEHRLIGEWFEGDKLCRDCVAIEIEALSEALGRDPPKLEWPYLLADDDATNDWIERCEGRRTIASINRQYSRIIRDMDKGEPEKPDTSRYWDVNLWTVLWRFERQMHTLVMSAKSKTGEEILIGHYEGSNIDEIVPHYTTNVAYALTLFPVNDRPTEWIGSAWNCCVTGIKARRVALRTNGLTALTADQRQAK